MSPEERDGLAAEYVLGVLETDDRARAEAMERADPAFAETVAAWRERLRDLDATATPAPVPDALWSRIGESLEAPRQESAARTTPVLVPDPRNAFRALWRNLAFWRIAGLASTAAALILAIGLAMIATRDARTPVMVAVLLTDANRPAALVNAFADGRAELVPLDPFAVPPDRTLEIWTLWDRARGLVSVGQLDRPSTVPLRLDAAPRPGPDQLFAVSLEPKGGSPTGQPTGPVLMKGTTSTPL